MLYEYLEPGDIFTFDCDDEKRLWMKLKGISLDDNEAVELSSGSVFIFNKNTRVSKIEKGIVAGMEKIVR